MSFFGNFGQPRKVTVIEQASDVILTKKGEDKMGRLEPVGNEWRIMSCIKENQPVTLDEIARKENLPVDKARYVVRDLIARGWVTKKDD